MLSMAYLDVAFDVENLPSLDFANVRILSPTIYLHR